MNCIAVPGPVTVTVMRREPFVGLLTVLAGGSSVLSMVL
jgi:hypothetical protein